MAKLQIKLVRSTIGTTPKQKKNVEALGLRRRAKVAHLVEVTERAEE